MRTALPQMKRQHNLHTFLLGLGCTIWLPPANGTEWRSIGPVERVGVAAGGVTNNVLTSNKTSATFNSTGYVDLGTVPVDDALQLLGAFTTLIICTPDLASSELYPIWIAKTSGSTGLGGWALATLKDGAFFVLLVDGARQKSDNAVVGSDRQLFAGVSNGIDAYRLHKNSATINSTPIGVWKAAENVAVPLWIGDQSWYSKLSYKGDMELVAIHPTRDLTETELAHAWALAQEF